MSSTILVYSLANNTRRVFYPFFFSHYVFFFSFLILCFSCYLLASHWWTMCHLSVGEAYIALLGFYYGHIFLLNTCWHTLLSLPKSHTNTLSIIFNPTFYITILIFLKQFNYDVSRIKLHSQQPSNISGLFFIFLHHEKLFLVKCLNIACLWIEFNWFSFVLKRTPVPRELTHMPV